MPSCVFRSCTNYSRKAAKGLGITYHSFPTDVLRRIKWTEVVCKQRKEDYWRPTSCSKICSVHFRDEDKYASSKGLILLKNTALPWIEVPESSQSITPKLENPDSPDSLEGEDVSEYLETDLGSPRTHAFEKTLSKVRAEKKELFRRILNIKRRNKRLKKKFAYLCGVLRSLKMQKHISDEVVNDLQVNEETKKLLNRVFSQKEGKRDKEDEDDDFDDDDDDIDDEAQN